MPQRSPVLFWLLLAATLSVDALVWNWPDGTDRRNLWKLQDALTMGQLSAVCAWSALRIKKPAWVQMMPWLAAVAASIVTPVMVIVSSQLRDSLTYHGVYVALLLAALWLFERSSFWRQRTDLSSVWRYSVAQLLLTMTIVAVLLAGIQSSPEFHNRLFWLGPVLCGHVAVTIAAVICWSSSRHALLSLAGTLGAALAVVVAVSLAFIAFSWRYHDAFLEVLAIFKSSALSLGPYYLVQAFVLSIWIGIGEVLPQATLVASD
jgi:hypothetical protein